MRPSGRPPALRTRAGRLSCKSAGTRPVKERRTMAAKAQAPFDVKSFLAKVGGGRSIVKYRKDHIVFSQGEPADAVFYIQKGKVKITVVSPQGKEAVIAILGSDDFFGEGCLAGQPRRMATVRAMTECAIMRIEKAAIVRLIRDEPTFSEMFMAHVLARTIRVEEDLVDQLFNSSEKRLARLLLLLANFGKDEKAGARDRKDQPGNARRNDRHDARARELFHEQIPEARLHQVQWRHRSAHLAAERDPPRSAADEKYPPPQIPRSLALRHPRTVLFPATRSCSRFCVCPSPPVINIAQTDPGAST